MKTILRRINYFIKDKRKKNYLLILKEVVHLWSLKKEFPKHYFGRFFYRVDSPDPNKFMSMKEYYTIVKSKNLKSPETDTILQNKLKFSNFCKKNAIPTAEVVGHNLGPVFFYENKEITLHNHNDLEKHFNTIFQTENKTSLFLKLIEGGQGIGAILVKQQNLSEKIQEIWDILKNNDYIHQNFIVQHEAINNIFSKTANTIRLETYVDKNKKIHFLGSYMRFGAGNAIVDNASSGGLFVPIDIEKGVLFDRAITNLKGGAQVYYEHPNSRISFKDFEIPFFDLVKKEVLNVTRLLPSTIVGWDIAITPEGPIIVEGNHHIPALLYGEYSYHGFMNKPIFKEIMEEAKK